MTFYDANETIRKRITDEETRCFPRIFYNGADGVTEFSNEEILSFELTSYKTVEGGIVTRAKMELHDEMGRYTDGSNAAFKRGLAVEVWFCFGIDGSADFKRCILYVGEKGFESLQDGGGEKNCCVEFVDYSFFLDGLAFAGNWKPYFRFLTARCATAETLKSRYAN